MGPQQHDSGGRGSAPGLQDGDEANGSVRLFAEEQLIARLLDDRATARAILQVFLEELPSMIAALEQALDAGDLRLLARGAHTIRGAAINIGGEALFQTATALELAALSGDQAQAVSGLEQLEDQVLPLERAIRTSALWSKHDDGYQEGR